VDAPPPDTGAHVAFDTVKVAAICLTVKTLDAPSTVNTTVPVLATPPLASAVTVTRSDVKPSDADKRIHDTEGCARHLCSVETTVTRRTPPVTGGDHAVSDNDTEAPTPAACDTDKTTTLPSSSKNTRPERAGPGLVKASR
jgi:hypothetical protein